MASALFYGDASGMVGKRRRPSGSGRKVAREYWVWQHRISSLAPAGFGLLSAFGYLDDIGAHFGIKAV